MNKKSQRLKHQGQNTVSKISPSHSILNFVYMQINSLYCCLSVPSYCASEIYNVFYVKSYLFCIIFFLPDGICKVVYVFSWQTRRRRSRLTRSCLGMNPYHKKYIKLLDTGYPHNEITNKWYVPLLSLVVVLQKHRKKNISAKDLSHWGRGTHICLGNQTITSSDNLCQCWNIVNYPLKDKFLWNCNHNPCLSFKKMHQKMSFPKWRPLVSAAMCQ